MNKYLSILQPIAELLQKKNTDYGDSYKKLRDEYGAVAFHVRISDKLSRIKQLDSADAQVKEESRRDTLNDIIGYCALEIAYMDNLTQTTGPIAITVCGRSKREVTE